MRHYDRGVRSFSLKSFKEVDSNAPWIQEALRLGRIRRPSFSDSASSGKLSQRANESQLTDPAIQTFVSWNDTGAHGLVILNPAKAGKLGIGS